VKASYESDSLFFI